MIRQLRTSATGSNYPILKIPVQHKRADFFILSLRAYGPRNLMKIT